MIRVKVAGYSSDRAALESTLLGALEGYTFYKNEGPDMTAVSISDDLERAYIAEQIRTGVSDLVWPDGPDEPSRDEILLEALGIIYGG